MAYKGQIITNCEKERPLTGRGNCYLTEGLTDAIILTSLNAYYPLDIEEFNAGVDEWVGDNGIKRMMPIKGVIADTPSGGEINTSQVGYGPIKPVNLSPYSDVFQIEGGLCLYKELSSANGQSYRVFRVDKQGYIYGTIVNVGGVDYFAGFEASVYAYQTKATDQTTAGGLFLGVYYGSNYEKEMQNINAFEVDNIPDGLVGVLLQKGTSAGTIKVVGSCGGDDYTSQFGSEWDETCFVNTSGANPTDVTFDSQTGLITLAPTGSYKVVSASILQSANIFGIEGIDKFIPVL